MNGSVILKCFVRKLGQLECRFYGNSFTISIVFGLFCSLIRHKRILSISWPQYLSIKHIDFFNRFDMYVCFWPSYIIIHPTVHEDCHIQVLNFNSFLVLLQKSDRFFLAALKQQRGHPKAVTVSHSESIHSCRFACVLLLQTLLSP